MATTDIFSLLPNERRKELELEALTSLMRGVLLKHKNATFGRLVVDLTKDKHWSALKELKLASVLTPGNTNGHSRRGRPPRDLPTGVVEKLLAAIKKHPKLRSEQLQKVVKLPQPVVKATLARLRRDGKVKTSGKRRVTTYTVA